MYQGKTVSVVMPAYNEENGVAQTVTAFKEHQFVDEVIVVDNNSTDRTAEIAIRSGATVIREPRQGYGHACRTGLSAATGDLIVLTESDDSFFAEDLKILFAYIDFFDMVKGARSNKHLIEPGADWTFALMFGNWVVAKYMQLLYFGLNFMEDVNLREVGGTFRVIKRHAYTSVERDLTEGKSAFLPDITTLFIRHRFKVIEVPVRYRRRIGESKITGSRIKAFFLAIRMMKIITKNRLTSLSHEA